MLQFQYKPKYGKFGIPSYFEIIPQSESKDVEPLLSIEEILKQKNEPNIVESQFNIKNKLESEKKQFEEQKDAIRISEDLEKQQLEKEKQQLKYEKQQFEKQKDAIRISEDLEKQQLEKEKKQLEYEKQQFEKQKDAIRISEDLEKQQLEYEKQQFEKQKSSVPKSLSTTIPISESIPIPISESIPTTIQIPEKNRLYDYAMIFKNVNYDNLLQDQATLQRFVDATRAAAVKLGIDPKDLRIYTEKGSTIFHLVWPDRKLSTSEQKELQTEVEDILKKDIERFNIPITILESKEAIETISSSKITTEEEIETCPTWIKFNSKENKILIKDGQECTYTDKAGMEECIKKSCEKYGINFGYNPTNKECCKEIKNQDEIWNKFQDDSAFLSKSELNSYINLAAFNSEEKKSLEKQFNETSSSFKRFTESVFGGESYAFALDLINLIQKFILNRLRNFGNFTREIFSSFFSNETFESTINTITTLANPSTIKNSISDTIKSASESIYEYIYTYFTEKLADNETELQEIKTEASKYVKEKLDELYYQIEKEVEALRDPLNDILSSTDMEKITNSLQIFKISLDDSYNSINEQILNMKISENFQNYARDNIYSNFNLEEITNNLLNDLDSLIIAYTDTSQRLFSWIKIQVEQFANEIWQWFESTIIVPTKQKMLGKYTDIKNYLVNKVSNIGESGKIYLSSLLSEWKTYLSLKLEDFKNYSSERYSILRKNVQEKLDDTFSSIKAGSSKQYEEITLKIYQYMDKVFEKINDSTNTTVAKLQSLYETYLGPSINSLAENISNAITEIDNFTTNTYAILKSAYEKARLELSNLQNSAYLLFTVAREKYAAWSEWVFSLPGIIPGKIKEVVNYAWDKISNAPRAILSFLGKSLWTFIKWYIDFALKNPGMGYLISFMILELRNEVCQSIMRTFGKVRQSRKVTPFEYAKELVSGTATDVGNFLTPAFYNTMYEYMKDNLEPFLTGGFFSVISGVGALFAGSSFALPSVVGTVVFSGLGVIVRTTSSIISKSATEALKYKIYRDDLKGTYSNVIKFFDPYTCFQTFEYPTEIDWFSFKNPDVPEEVRKESNK